MQNWRALLRGGIVTALLGVCVSLYLPSMALAGLTPASASPRNWPPFPYQPKMLTSLDDVVKALETTRSGFAYWCTLDAKTSNMNCITYGLVAKMNLSRDHVEFWGVDRSGAPLKEMALDSNTIERVGIYSGPAVDARFAPFAVCITLKHDKSSHTHFSGQYWLRALNLGTAQKIADAFATLAEVGAGKLTIADHSRPPRFGISARALNAQEKKASAVDSGVYVGRVEVHSPAAEMGILSGDYLLEINGSKITDVDTAKKLLMAAPVASVKVWRKGKIFTLSMLTDM